MAPASVNFDIQRIALFSDIHSNYEAFRACYEDAAAQGVQGFLFLGDYISDLADARKTLELVYEIRARYPTLCLRGNRERYLLECRRGLTSFQPGSKSGSLLYTYECLREEDFLFLQQLPSALTLSIFGQTVEIAHAVRGNDRFYFEPGSENMPLAYQSMAQPILLTGHSHKQYRHQCHGKTIINPGSVGIPQQHSCHAQYAILSWEAGAPCCRFRQIPYPIRTAIRRQFESGLVAKASCWAISILYDIIAGEEYTMALLQKVAQEGEAALLDEAVWQRCAQEMGMKLTLEEILRFCDEQLPL